jgi:hypothetical protein
MFKPPILPPYCQTDVHPHYLSKIFVYLLFKFKSKNSKMKHLPKKILPKNQAKTAQLTKIMPAVLA